MTVNIRPYFSGRIRLDQAKCLNVLPRPLIKDKVDELVLEFKNNIEDYSNPMFVLLDDEEGVEQALAANEPVEVTILVFFI